MSVDAKYTKKKGRIMAYLRRPEFRHNTAVPHPFIFEFNGSPHSGKTTTIIEIDKFLRRHGFRVLRLQESGEAIRHIDRTAPVYNIRTGLYTLTHLLDHIHAHNYDVIIYERGIFDAYCWMQYRAKMGQITKKQLGVIQNFLLMDFWANEIDLAYFMICAPEQARKREFGASISKRLNTKNVEIVKLYRNAYRRLSKKFPQLKIVDTTNLGKKEVAEIIALDILDTMERKTTR